MNKKKVKNILIITLMLIEVITLSLTYKSFTNKPLKEANEINEVDKKKYAMYIENDTGEYEEYTTSEKFPVGYKVNLDKSQCTDIKGNVINGILTGIGNKVTITSNKTSYCYIYFDKDYKLSELCSSGDNLGSCITDNNEEIDSLGDTAYSGMYRYTGTNEIVDDNYICFGTDDKEKCVNNPETYMYRVIGVTSEANDTLGLETNQLKLIKHTSIGTHQWHSDYTTDTKWESSTMYTYLQNDVLNNTTYYPSGWSNKIDNIKWNIGDVQIFDTQLFADALTVYELENELQTTSESKIGLIYISDWYYSFTNTSVDCFSSSCMSWIIDKSVTNWSMTRYSYYVGGGYTRAFPIGADGKNYIIYINNRFGVRPVFYLNSDEQYISGDGTIDNPIMLSEPQIPTAGETILSNPTTGLDATTPYSGLYRYIGTEANNYVKLSDETNEVLYRIIGIVSEDNETLGLEKGQLKLIKDTSIGTYKWHNDSTTNTKWESSTMHTYLQDDVLSDTNVVPSGWSGKISSVKWNIGDVNSTGYLNGITIVDCEDNVVTNAKSKIGLIYLSDYYYAYISGGSTYCEINKCSSWMTDTADYIWTMSRFKYDYSANNSLAWAISTSGIASHYVVILTRSVKPTFYLSKNVYITNSEATGSSTDPFILSY